MMDRDRWLSAEEAKEVGLVDHVVASRDDVIKTDDKK